MPRAFLAAFLGLCQSFGFEHIRNRQRTACRFHPAYPYKCAALKAVGAPSHVRLLHTPKTTVATGASAPADALQCSACTAPATTRSSRKSGRHPRLSQSVVVSAVYAD